jgi:hypothetical protein
MSQYAPYFCPIQSMLVTLILLMGVFSLNFAPYLRKQEYMTIVKAVTVFR